MDERDARSLGFATFAGGTATSLALMTGDSVLNAACVGFSGVKLSWLGWATYMTVPGLIASALMWGLHLAVFRPRAPIVIDRQALEQEQLQSGPLSSTEKRTLLWVALALGLWATDALHYIDPAWVALGVAVGLALPVVGGVLESSDFASAVNWSILLFVVGALAIGAVSKETGLASWLVNVLLPAAPPANPYAFALLVGTATMGIHMVLGSALAVLSIVAPPMVAYATAAGWNGLFPALLVYTAVQIHYLLPFQHVTILLSEGAAGGYGPRETLRYGLPLTVVVIGILFIEVAWWQWLGFI